MVRANGYMYMAKNAITAGSFNPAHWAETTPGATTGVVTTIQTMSIQALSSGYNNVSRLVGGIKIYLFAKETEKALLPNRLPIQR